MARRIGLAVGLGLILLSAIEFVVGLVLVGAGQASGFIPLPILTVGVAGWLLRQALRSDDLPLPSALGERGGPLPAQAEAFLDTLDDSLGLPADICAEVRAELSDHLANSIAAIEAEGLDRDRATREAMARLGRPEELARQLRAAHQSTRRLLAGAAGGVFQAGIGALWGYVLGCVLFVLLVIVAILPARPVVDFIGDRLGLLHLDPWAGGFGTFPGAAVACLVAFVAGRWSLRALVTTSQRRTAQVARWWALGGFLLLAYFMTFRLTAQQGWLVVPLELLVPVAFAAGVLFRTERRLPFGAGRAPSLLAILILATVPVLVLVAAPRSHDNYVTWADYSWSSDLDSVEQARQAGFDRVAPLWSDGDIVKGFGELNSSVLDMRWHVFDKEGLARFSDLRFEAWRAVSYQAAYDSEDYYVPAAGYSEPAVIAPAVLGYDNWMRAYAATARLDFRHIRNARWTVFLTGIGPDGIRYRLGREPASARIPFSGTVWDWLTASD